jgi:hypothetical protein
MSAACQENLLACHCGHAHRSFDSAAVVPVVTGMLQHTKRPAASGTVPEQELSATEILSLSQSPRFLLP